MITKVDFTRITKALKNPKRVPARIVAKFFGWVQEVATVGLEQARRIPGYHDEPLAGKLQGERSVRLNRSWRVFYRIVRVEFTEEGRYTENVEIVKVERINNHEYQK